jgi:CheY-like chemotaxis protein
MTIRILLASKNQTNIDLVKEALHRRDVDIILAAGMSLALFLAKKNLPVLVISDLELMDGDGLAFLQELRCDSQLKEMPFIFLLPNQPGEELKKTLLESGAERILLSSTKPEALLALIDQLIDWQRIQIDQRQKETTE